MKRLAFLVLAASVGLNAALLWQHFAPRPADRPPFAERGPGGPPMGGPRGGPEGPDADLPPRGGQPPSYADMQERRLQNMARRLELDEDQVDALREIALEHAAEMDSLRVAARAARGRIHDLLAAPDVDEAAVREAAAHLREVSAAIEAHITENMLREVRVLDPGQRERYLGMMRFGNNRGRRGR